MKLMTILRNAAQLSLAVAMSVNIGCGETLTTGDDRGDTVAEDKRDPIDNKEPIVDPDADGNTDDDYLYHWDTGTGEKACMGEYMTAEDCMAANGSFDMSFIGFKCVEGQEQRCCLTDTLTNPCPFECMSPVDCYNREGTGTAWEAGYECAAYSDKCCQGAAPLDQDTDGFLGELFDPFTCPVETPVTLAEQPDKIASGICSELMDESSPFFCPQADYDRIVRDMAAIKAAYPVVEADRGGQIYNGFGEAILPFTILCVPGFDIDSCTDFPKGAWQDILDCFGADHEHCLFEDEDAGTCGQSHLWFEVGVNTKRMMSFFEEHAKGLVPGSVCELNGYVGLSYPLNGFHVADYGDGIWRWSVRVTNMFELSTVHCDVRLVLSTNATSTQLTEISIENFSDQFCDDPAFN